LPLGTLSRSLGNCQPFGRANQRLSRNACGLWWRGTGLSTAITDRWQTGAPSPTSLLQQG